MADFIAANYPEAVGIMMAIKAGVPLPAVHRPLKYPDVVCESFENISSEDAIETVDTSDHS